MKKIIPLILSSLLLASCNNVPVPEDIKSFINNINFNMAYKGIKEGIFTQSYTEKNGDTVTGTNSINFTFSQDEDNFKYHAIYTYEGNQIKNNISYKEITMKFVSNDEYIREEKTNLETTSKNMNYEEAHAYWYKIFDSGVNSYRIGGIYYGDYFAINMNQYYKLYSLNQDKTILTMKETGAVYIEGIYLDQQIDIDNKGMLLYKKEHAYSADIIHDGLLIQNASYVY